MSEETAQKPDKGNGRDPDPAPLDAQAALALLKQDLAQRTKACATAVQAVLDEQGFAIDVAMEISVRGVLPRVRFVPKEG